MRFAVLALVVVALVATGSIARADGAWSSAYQNPWSSWDAYSYKRVEDQVRARTKAALDPVAGKAADKAASHQPLAATDFKRTPGPSVLDRSLAATKLPAEQASQLRTALDAVLAEIGKQTRKDNVATAMGVLVAASTYVVNRVELDDPTQDRLIASLNDLLAADPAFGKLKAKDKQQMADTMLVQAALIIALAGWGQSDPSARQAAEAAGRGALKFLTGSETGVVATR